MTGRDYMHKWGIYGAVLLVLFLLETVLLTRIPVAGICPMLFPLAVVAAGVFESPTAGAGFGLVAGILHGAFSYEDGRLMPLGLAIVGMLAGVISQRFLKQGFVAYLLSSLVGLVILDGSRILVRLAGGEDALAAMLRVSMLEIAYSFLFTVPVYLIFRAVFRRVGGTSLV